MFFKQKGDARKHERTVHTAESIGFATSGEISEENSATRILSG